MCVKLAIPQEIQFCALRAEWEELIDNEIPQHQAGVKKSHLPLLNGGHSALTDLMTFLDYNLVLESGKKIALIFST